MKRILIALVLSALSIDASAVLISRAAGAAYYDDVLDITWLADMNYAQTSGYDVDGQMTWDESLTWIGTLNTANLLGVNNWRLPTVTDTGTSGCNFAFTGTDCGYDVDTSTGEMANLFYDTLGNLAFYDTSGNPFQPGWGLSHTGPFSNLQPYSYWSGTEYAPNPTDYVWYFHFDTGTQRDGYKANGLNSLYALAVRSGDIAAVPVPAAVWLFGSALLGLLGMRRVRR